MSFALAVSLLVVIPTVIGTQVPEPSTSDLASSVTVYDLSGSVTVYDARGSVTVLQTEAKRGNQTVVTISTDVLFDFGSAALTSDAQGRITGLAAQIAGTTEPVTVVGHTDSVGDDAFNLNLSNQRAKAAAAVLQAALPAGTQVLTEGRGAREPVAPNAKVDQDDPEGRAKNRRVTVSFTPRP